MDVVRQVLDPGEARGKRHDWLILLTPIASAVASGCRVDTPLRKGCQEHAIDLLPLSSQHAGACPVIDPAASCASGRHPGARVPAYPITGGTQCKGARCARVSDNGSGCMELLHTATSPSYPLIMRSLLSDFSIDAIALVSALFATLI